MHKFENKECNVLLRTKNISQYMTMVIFLNRTENSGFINSAKEINPWGTIRVFNFIHQGVTFFFF